jgi:COP9 signalosome complex subunit 4
MVVGRTVLGAYVSALTGGVELAKPSSGDNVGEDKKWSDIGSEVFKGQDGSERRKEVVEGVLTPGGLASWCEEQVSAKAVALKVG